MRSTTSNLDRASAGVRPRDPLVRLALWLGVGLEIIAILRLVPAGLLLGLCLLGLALLTLVVWQPVVTLLVAAGLVAAIVYRRVQRRRAVELARRERERETDREIPF